MRKGSLEPYWHRLSFFVLFIKVQLIGLEMWIMKSRTGTKVKL